ncbi:MAG: hypothetical protein ABI650_08770 [Dokdonella sp.]
MTTRRYGVAAAIAMISGVLACASLVEARLGHAREVSHLSPHSDLFENGVPLPVRAKYLPGQPFDLVAVVQTEPGSKIEYFEFYVDGKPTRTAAMVRERAYGDCSLAAQRREAAVPCAILPDAENAENASTVLMQTHYAQRQPGVHVFKLVAWQDNGARLSASGNFEIVDPASAPTHTASSTPRD